MDSKKSKKSPKVKSAPYDDDTDEKSAEKLALTRNESPYTAEGKRDRNGTVDDKGTPVLRDQIVKPDIEDFRLDNASPMANNKDKSPEVSSSNSEDTSSSSEDEANGAKKQEEKEAGAKPIWEVLDKQEKERAPKKSKNQGKSSNSFVFKSSDNPNTVTEKKPDSNKRYEGAQKRHQRKRKCKNPRFG